MDGKQVSAEKRYVFADRGAFFDAKIRCSSDDTVGFTIESHVSDGGPELGAEFLFSVDVDPLFGGVSDTLKGRIRIRDGDPSALSPTFARSNYSNVIVLVPWQARALYKEVSGITADTFYHPVWNDSAIFWQSLPIVLDMQTGRGSFEVVINRSDAIKEVVSACGGLGEPYVKSGKAVLPEEIEHAISVSENINPTLENTDLESELPVVDDSDSQATEAAAANLIAKEEEQVEADRDAQFAPGVIRDEPRYPPAAYRQGLQGTTVLWIDIGTQGEIIDVSIAQSSGSQDLDEAAKSVAQKWTFIHAISNGEAVPSRISVPVSFALR